ncbi:hypothetical protein IQ249_24155 [Lusitaniella coriacea LEGE 07157]|uniref:Uncharacterized protein n=1 Tax=Lusitaniella coriacea LEGE 07157 TaxID=945747 RepID=A0A8J7E0Q1_9CYAN|nr:hypothetical protein [Lusitaniella coriacea]MBE9118988.1 hypothetical protein [Lusitaniella coriacea LEGE 07157]
MAAFEGAANPQRAIENGYYIEQPGRSLAETIAARIALRPSSTHILVGGIGSGKTTQLLVTRDRINEIGDIKAIYVDVSLYTDIFKIKPLSLMAITGLVLSELIGDSEGQDIEKSRALFHKLAYGFSENKDILGSAVNLNRVVRHRGVLVDKPDNPRAVFQAMTKLQEAATTAQKSITLLFDGLDRLDDAQIFSQLVTSDIQSISESGIGVVLVTPLIVAYSDYRGTIEQAVQSFEYQSCFDVFEDANAYNFFEKVIKTRAANDFIQEPAIQNLIVYSGGVLRDLISLTEAAIEEAYLLDSDKVYENHVEAAVIPFARAKSLGLSYKEREILWDLSEEGKFNPTTKEGIKLLAAHHIIEYRYPERRFLIHPVIQPLFQHEQITYEEEEEITDEDVPF